MTSIEVTEAMQAAWVNYEPPGTAAALTHRQVLLSKHAFLMGYKAAMHKQQVVTPDVVERVARAIQRARDEIGATEQQRIAFAYAEAAMRSELAALPPIARQEKQDG